MTTATEIAVALAALLNAVDGIGQIHDREKFGKTNAALMAHYAVESQIRGGFIRRAGYRKESADGGHDYLVTTSWELHYFSSFLDTDESEKSFNDRIDAMDAAVRADQTLGGVVEATVTPEQAGLAMVSSQPAMFAGVLVHYAKLTLHTEHSEIA